MHGLTPSALLGFYCFFFFLKAEGGIGVVRVIGVQGCPLPIPPPPPPQEKILEKRPQTPPLPLPDPLRPPPRAPSNRSEKSKPPKSTLPCPPDRPPGKPPPKSPGPAPGWPPPRAYASAVAGSILSE